MNEIALFTPATIAAFLGPNERYRMRITKFFTAQIRNPNTRQSRAKATVDFLQWRAARRTGHLDAIMTVISS